VTLVLDASITLAGLLEDEDGHVALDALRGAVIEGAVVPALWRLEIANALSSAVKRKRCDEAFVDSALKRLTRMHIVVDAETDVHAWNATLSLSRSEGLTVYDAAYLELAIRLGATLASFDRDLVAAARRRGLDVLTA
jgi:predicted nucleic acid-binding protein